MLAPTERLRKVLHLHKHGHYLCFDANKIAQAQILRNW